MSHMSEMEEMEPSSFKESVENPIWVAAMVEEYDSIIKNSVREVVLRLVDK